MTTFCGNCGSPLDANIAFCGRCGSPAGSRPNAAATPPPPSRPVQPPPPVVSSSGSSFLKIALVLVCFLFLGGIVVVGGIFYMAHRVKQAVVQKAAENGVDLGGLTSENTVRRNLPKPCDLLTKDEISRLIGEPIERSEPKDAMCMYYGPAGLSTRLAQSHASETFHRAQAPGSKTDGMEVATSVDQVLNNLGSQTGQTDGSEQPLLMLALDADGKAQMMAISASKAIFGSLGRSATDPNQKGISFGSDIPDLGDKAVRIPKLGLNVLKSGVLIRIIPGPIPAPDAKTIAVARAILPKI